jgi:hypothetical protein
VRGISFSAFHQSWIQRSLDRKVPVTRTADPAEPELVERITAGGSSPVGSGQSEAPGDDVDDDTPIGAVADG